MTTTISETVRTTIVDLLEARGQDTQIGDNESLFDSGRLDSVAAVNVLLTLESEFGVDLSDPDFDMSQIDTLQEISTLVSSQTA
ncbi:phosphopantetheine-binding protein [Hoeflea sp. G2-23]|uniref:Phosphopantetheine-binding protein n=1 Tax=Hoeflea algicola TaxID=2983763 RepID=A0ABT3ZDG1_9HYPH|nr:phosphopantetheine-binding protein [Hoeflea algicola]MCY0149671.1 phosphopantetheine-binding protein [Hoeflea algicola]